METVAVPAPRVAMIATPRFLPMAEHIVTYLGEHDVPAIVAHIEKESFADGEINHHILDNIRNKQIYFLCEMRVKEQAHRMWNALLLMDAIQRASSGEICVVLPYFPYGRQDRRKDGERVPISAQAVVHHLEVAGAKKLFAFDLHATQIEGYAKRFEHLNGRKVLAEHARTYFKNDFQNVVSVSADIGGGPRNKKFAMRLDPTMRLMSGEKRRSGTNTVSEWHLMGDPALIKGSDVVMHDDIVDTGGTILLAGKSLFDLGAKSVTVYATHGTFGRKDRPAEEKLAESGIKVVITDTIPREPAYYATHSSWLSVVTIETMLAEAIRRDITGESISEFKGQ